MLLKRCSLVCVSLCFVLFHLLPVLRPNNKTNDNKLHCPHCCSVSHFIPLLVLSSRLFVMSKQGSVLLTLFVKDPGTKSTDSKQCVLLFTIKFYFGGIVGVSCFFFIKRGDNGFKALEKCSGNLITVYTCWKKMLAPGQIKRLLLNRNRLVRVLVWNTGREEVWETVAATWLR